MYTTLHYFSTKKKKKTDITNFFVKFTKNLHNIE